MIITVDTYLHIFSSLILFEIITYINNITIIFFSKKGFCEERTAYDWTNKEKSKSLDKPSYNNIKKEEKEKDKKDTKKDLCETEVEVKRSNKGKYGTNEMLESDNPPPEYKSDYMVIDLGDAEVNSYIINTINDICYVLFIYILSLFN